MADVAKAREQAREAQSRRDWHALHGLFDVQELPDDAELLDAFSEAAWWLGRLDECVAARERVYAVLEAAGDRQGAARAAMLLYDNNCFKARPAVATGWLRRAQRLLEGEPECLQHGCLTLRQGEATHSTGDLEGARAQFERAIEIGRRFGDADLEADGLQALGRSLIAEGKPHDGLAALDEAMLSAIEGKLGPFTTGKVYCSLISACEELGDLRRAAEWTDAGGLWADENGHAVFPGLCRVHRAEVLQLQGSWTEAEREARRACAELDQVNLGNAATGFHELGEIRRRLGDLEGAEEAFKRADELGGHAQPGLALLRLAQGKVSVAAASIGLALAGEQWNKLGRAKLLPAQVQIAIAAGDLTTARAAADELEQTAATYASPGLRAAAASARGRLELAEGDPTAACGILGQALRRWQDLDVPYEVATTRLLNALAARELGDEESAHRSFEEAARIFERLGASLDAKAAHELRDLRAATGPSLPDGLTEREAEVLRLVASGQSNKAVAGALFLSEKTVARHLSNIFVKIGVSSRAGATAYAFEQGIVDRGS